MADDPIIKVLQENVPEIAGTGSFVGNMDPEAGFGRMPLGLSRVVPGATSFGGYTALAQYEGATREELLLSALEMPLSLFSTMEGSARSGVLESFGLGTVIRGAQLPEEAPSEQGVVVGPEGSQTTVPDTSTLRRRMAAFGDLANVRPETAPELQQRRDDVSALDENAYKASAWFRKDIPWDAGMTEARASALATMDDAKKVREFYAQKRPFSAFLGNMAGQALDPINYVPVAGPLVKAAAIGRFGKIAGGALIASADAAANTGLFAIATAGERAKFGDDVSWQSTVSQIATAALIGAAFGTVSGVIGKRVDARRMSQAESRLATLRTTQESRIALNEGIDALANGNDIRLSPNSTDPIARIAGDVAKTAPAVEPVAVTKTATTADIAESLRVVREQHPELDPVTSPSKFDSLLIADLQAKGFDAIENTAPAGPVPLNFDPSTVDVPEMVIGPNGTPVEASLNPTSPAYGRRMIADAEARLPALRKQLAKANRPHNLLRAKLAQNSILDTFVDPIGTIGRNQDLPRLVSYYEGQKAQGEAIVAGKVDTTRARPEPLPDGLKEAAARIAKADDAAALEAQYGVNHKTGAYNEEAEILHLATTGRLTEEDVNTLAAAHRDYDQASAYAEAMKSLASCLI
ncbi:hypothetical protein [Mesorhizobium sp. L2C067A000]|uniref:hypothetical protein n=1 Tax=Mesorhizobium sp. L2C067A000 TaxID=1287106 RepID=UPI0003CFED2D|nr:hypothetical protein [Mesorhizobium sp. L2C067A000]ESZ31245.1 hypothetical protein X733_22485 [Mesorhizobium sp. L2C067A000]